MKLLTLNCHSWIEENQMEKIKILAKIIREKSYDVIALQEVNQSIDAESVDGLMKKDNFALVLLKELQQLGITDYQMIWDYSHIGYDIYEEGVALLTRHPIEEKHSFFVSDSEDTKNWKTRKIAGITIRSQHELLSFYSCHLGWWEDEQEPFKAQMNRLIEIVGKDKKYFLMGDFNNAAHIRGEGYDFVLNKGLYDTYSLAQEKDEGITVAGNIAGWDDNKEDLRVDYIFSNVPITVYKSSVIFNGKNQPVISDHFGVELVLE